MSLEKRKKGGTNDGRSVSRSERGILDAYTRIRTAHVRVAGSNGRARRLPGSLHSFLTELMEELETGKPVTIFEANAELTTMEAAKMLGVSRQFVVGLLEGGAIPFHMVGTHRRVYARDVLAFRAKRDAARRRKLDSLARAEMSEGLYDRVPLNEARAK